MFPGKSLPRRASASLTAARPPPTMTKVDCADIFGAPHVQTGGGGPSRGKTMPISTLLRFVADAGSIGSRPVLLVSSNYRRTPGRHAPEEKSGGDRGRRSQ